MPSRRRQTSATARAFPVVERELRPARSGPFHEESHRVGRCHDRRGAGRRLGRHRQGAQPPHLLAGDARAPRGSSPGSARRGHDAARRRRGRRAGSSRCSQLSSTRSMCFVREEVEDALSPGHAGPVDGAERRGDDVDHRLGVVRRRELAEPRAVLQLRHQLGGHLEREARLADAADADDRHHPVLLEEGSRSPRRSCSRPTKLVSCTGRFDACASSERIGGNSVPRPGATSWNTRSGRVRSRRRCSPRSTQIDVGGEHVTRELLGRVRDEHLAAVRDRHQPRRPVDRGAVVVAVASLGAAGVDRPCAP